MKPPLDVTLINPSFDRSKMGPFQKYVRPILPLSLGFLAGYLISKGITPRMIDEQLNYMTREAIDELFKGKGRVIVGLSCLTAGAARSYELAGWIKAADPDAVIVYGGVHATVLPEEVLGKGSADVVVRNEGEETFYELVRCFSNEISIENVKGISFKKGDMVIHTEDRQLIKDLDQLPSFPYGLFSGQIQEYSFGNVLTSRGCPYECIFCSQRSISGRAYRYRSVIKVLEELDELILKYKQTNIIFNDDNFVVNRERVIGICEGIIKRNYPKSVSFLAMARGDMVDPDMLGLMKKAGFASIFFGLETASPRLMKLIKKRLTVEDNKKAIEMTHAAGITTVGAFILGLPTETREESLATIRFARSLPLDLNRFNLLVPYPGTEAFQMMGHLKKEKLDWSNFITVSGLGQCSIPFIPEGRTEKEMRRLQLWANVSFYLRPRQLLNLIRGGFADQFKMPPILSFQGVKAYSELVIYITAMLLGIRTKKET